MTVVLTEANRQSRSSGCGTLDLDQTGSLLGSHLFLLLADGKCVAESVDGSNTTAQTLLWEQLERRNPCSIPGCVLAINPILGVFAGFCFINFNTEMLVYRL